MLKKLLVIGPTPPPFHGVSVAIQTLLDSHLRDHFRVLHLDIADRRGGNTFIQRQDLHDVTLFVRQWLALIRLLFRERPDIVYLAISQTTLGVARDSLFLWPVVVARSRIVLHLHGANFRAWLERANGLLRICTRSLLRRTDRMIVLGESLRPIFAGLIPDGRICVVPNGVPELTGGRPPGSRPGGGPFRVLYLGTMNRSKGVVDLVRAAVLVLHARRDVEFVFAGGWSEADTRAEAEALIGAEFAPHFHFLGPVSGAPKRDALMSSDVLVFPAIAQQGQALVALEAMEAGMPVITTDRGCMRETVVDGETGFVVGVGDVADLADKILWLLDNPALRLQMGGQARRRYEALYTERRHAELMIACFNQIPL